MAEKLANKPQKLNKKAKGVRPSLFSVFLKMKNFLFLRQLTDINPFECI